MAEKKITISVNKDEFVFNVTSLGFDSYINSTTPDNKVAPAKNFLRRSLVDKKQQETLDDLCDRGHTLTLAGHLVQEFQSEVEIEVKK